MSHALHLEVVTPRGVALRRSQVHEVVVRRREDRFEQGSEIAILPGHGEMLVRIPPHVIQVLGEGSAGRVAVGDGFVEVLDDRILVLATEAEFLGEEPVSCKRRGS